MAGRLRGPAPLCQAGGGRVGTALKAHGVPEL